jgi:glycosyltransferase involved in cell wall biosynthesis
MKLLAISHTPHYIQGSQITGFGPTVREIDFLSDLFDEVVHVAPLHREQPPRSAIPYESPIVRVRPVAATGGAGIPAKLRILHKFPSYAKAIAEELETADVVHVRCPSNIGLLASVMLACSSRPFSRWIKYAGNWRPSASEAWSYSFQRWWLRKRWHGAVVTVNGTWSGDPHHVRPFLNPCLTLQEWEEARRKSCSKELSLPINLLYVGRLEQKKGIERAVEITAAVQRSGLRVSLDVVGDGPMRAQTETLARKATHEGSVRFHGWLPRSELGGIYARAHILVLPTNSSEGWPKVLSEGMAYGVVPLAGAVSCIPQLLREYKTGRSHPAEHLNAFVADVSSYAANPDVWRTESRSASAVAEHFTYTKHLERVAALLNLNHASSYRLVDCVSRHTS